MYLPYLFIFVTGIYLVNGRPSSWNWYKDMEQEDEASESLGLSSLFYNTFKVMQERMDFYAPAIHAGMVSRGYYAKPELLQPRHRTFGWNSDFKQQDGNAFRNKPSFPKPQCREVKSVTKGFDCRCGVSRRKEESPYHAPLGTLATDGTGPAMPAMEAIVGGVKTEIGEYPWQVGLELDGHINCGGSILSSKTILSAAHCTIVDTSIDERTGLPKFTEAQRDRLRVVVSQHGSRVGATDQVLDVCHIEEHADYFEFDNDFAILTLCSPVTFYASVQPICLPSLPARSYDGVRATTSGWGSLSASLPPFPADPLPSQYPSSLMEVNVTTMPNSVCRAFYGLVTDNMICAMDDGKDSCEGDSGGPLVALEPCGHFALIGVVSFGTGCADPKKPGVYARVTQQREWIESRIYGSKCPPPSVLRSF